ncbi:hypothetical protein SASPL_106905 [Salvia splendens]|uniref:NADP-dependent oxidoreductase domain-containing protein n=1 Tax=Salvia splendens TaxID=180675 RepID=A0A8X8YFI1_SALSN|nr:hypothetical protein SASPL_106905 [Salvia splendens]
MYLVHWPVRLKAWVCDPIPKEDEFEPLCLDVTWSGMEKCLEMGLCRGIGVEMHPMWRQEKLRDFCRDQNIHVSAYSPLATPAQIALSWGLSKEVSVNVKSFNQERMKENKGAIDLKLEDEEILEIDSMFKEMKILRGEVFVNQSTSPYKTLQDLWDYEI